MSSLCAGMNMEFGLVMSPVDGFQQNGSSLTFILSHFVTLSCIILGRETSFGKSESPCHSCLWLVTTVKLVSFERGKIQLIYLYVEDSVYFIFLAWCLMLREPSNVGYNRDFLISCQNPAFHTTTRHIGSIGLFLTMPCVGGCMATVGHDRTPIKWHGTHG